MEAVQFNDEKQYGIMPQPYRIVINNDRYKYVKPFQVSVFILIAILLAFVSYYKKDYSGYLWPVLLVLSAVILLNEKRLQQYKFFRFTNFKESGFLWAIAGCLILISWWMALLVIALAMTQLLVKKHFEIIFNEEGFDFRSFPKTHKDWQQVQNIVLKDDLLTIDYRNNKILQVEIIPVYSNIGSEAEFNEFCREMLALENKQSAK